MAEYVLSERSKKDLRDIVNYSRETWSEEQAVVYYNHQHQQQRQQQLSLHLNKNNQKLLHKQQQQRQQLLKQHKKHVLLYKVYGDHSLLLLIVSFKQLKLKQIQ